MKHMKNKYGFSLIELLIVMAIFSVVMAGLYAATSVQLREGVKEYRLAESEMELGISKNIIERDISMAGYGLMDDYDFDGDGTPNFTPRAVGATDGNPDTLTLMGTALGLASRAAQGWAPAQSVAGTVPSFMKFNDAREDIRPNDRIIIMDPNTKGLVGDGTEWRFRYDYNTTTSTSKIVQLLANGSDGAVFTKSFVGMTVYGINHSGTTEATQPYYAVRYYLPDAVSSPPPALCAPGTRNLLRAESRTDAAPANGEPILNCVLDFQVALGLDTNEDGTIDSWDNGGVTAQGYASKDLNKRLKQVRVYALVQAGNRDQSYTYSNPDPAYASTPDKIRVGDLYLKGGATGRDSPPLTAEQRKYRWKVVTFAVTPRNTR